MADQILASTMSTVLRRLDEADHDPLPPPLARADEVARPQAPRNRTGPGDEVPTPRSRDFR